MAFSSYSLVTHCCFYFPGSLWQKKYQQKMKDKRQKEKDKRQKVRG
jgi:hypothetical protein